MGYLPRLLKLMLLLPLQLSADSQRSMVSRALLSSPMPILSSFLSRFCMISCTLSGKIRSKIWYFIGQANSRGSVRERGPMDSQRQSGKELAHSQHHLAQQSHRLMDVGSQTSQRITTSAQLRCGPFGHFISALFYCGEGLTMWSITSILFSLWIVLCWPWPEARSQAKPSQNQAKPSQAKMLVWVGFSLGLTFWKAKAIGLGQGLSALLGAHISARLSAHESAATTSFLMVYSVNCCAQPCTLQKLACTNIYVLYALYFSD